MKLFPAIDLIDGCAVRLFKGDYAQKTVYSNSPLEVAKGFKECGAEYLHLVDLDGAKSGKADNILTTAEIIEKSGLKVEIGGGIRTPETVKQYIDIGVLRVIIGTAAVTNRPFLLDMLDKYGDKVAVGVDMKDGMVAIHGWTETSALSGEEFISDMQSIGVKTVIVTDISKDGAMAGTNRELYRTLREKFTIDVTASGGVSTIDDVKALNDMDIYGAILGKALYTGGIDLAEACRLVSK